MHPLFHLFTVVWLFGNWEAFWLVVERALGQRCAPDSDLTDLRCEDRNAAYRQKLGDVMAEESRLQCAFKRRRTIPSSVSMGTGFIKKLSHSPASEWSNFSELVRMTGIRENSGPDLM